MKLIEGKTYVQVLMEPNKARTYDEIWMKITTKGSQLITREQFYGLAEHQGAEVLQPVYVEEGWLADWRKLYPSGSFVRK